MGPSSSGVAVGSDLMRLDAIWNRLRAASVRNGRRGGPICALGAFDTALHATWRTLPDRACREFTTPQAPLVPDVSNLNSYGTPAAERALRAKSVGITTTNLETLPSGPDGRRGRRASSSRKGDAIRAVPDIVPSNLVLAVYAQHAFGDADASLGTIRGWDPHGPFPFDAARSADVPQGYARLGRERGVPTAAGKWPTAHSELVDLMDRRGGGVQPDFGRVGGLRERREVRELAAERG